MSKTSKIILGIVIVVVLSVCVVPAAILVATAPISTPTTRSLPEARPAARPLTGTVNDDLKNALLVTWVELIKQESMQRPTLTIVDVMTDGELLEMMALVCVAQENGFTEFEVLDGITAGWVGDISEDDLYMMGFIVGGTMELCPDLR